MSYARSKPINIADINIDNLKGIVKGIASTTAFSNKYKYVIDTGAFEKSIKNKKFKGNNSIKFLFDHNSSKILGNIINLKYNEDNELFIEAKINKNISLGKDVLETLLDIQDGGFSVGFIPKIVEDVNGVKHVKEGDLKEVSLTFTPDNKDCVITDVLNERQNIVDELAIEEDGLKNVSEKDAEKVNLSKEALDQFNQNLLYLKNQFSSLDEKVTKIVSSFNSVSSPKNDSEEKVKINIDEILTEVINKVDNRFNELSKKILKSNKQEELKNNTKTLLNQLKQLKLKI